MQNKILKKLQAKFPGNTFKFIASGNQQQLLVNNQPTDTKLNITNLTNLLIGREFAKPESTEQLIEDVVNGISAAIPARFLKEPKSISESKATLDVDSTDEIPGEVAIENDNDSILAGPVDLNMSDLDESVFVKKPAKAKSVPVAKAKKK